MLQCPGEPVQTLRSPRPRAVAACRSARWTRGARRARSTSVSRRAGRSQSCARGHRPLRARRVCRRRGYGAVERFENARAAPHPSRHPMEIAMARAASTDAASALLSIPATSSAALVRMYRQAMTPRRCGSRGGGRLRLTSSTSKASPSGVDAADQPWRWCPSDPSGVWFPAEGHMLTTVPLPTFLTHVLGRLRRGQRVTFGGRWRGSRSATWVWTVPASVDTGF